MEDLNVNWIWAAQIGHAIIWFFLSIITLGICFLIYYYKVAQYAIEKTVIEPV